MDDHLHILRADADQRLRVIAGFLLLMYGQPRMAFFHGIAMRLVDGLLVIKIGVKWEHAAGDFGVAFKALETPSAPKGVERGS